MKKDRTIITGNASIDAVLDKMPEAVYETISESAFRSFLVMLMKKAKVIKCVRDFNDTLFFDLADMIKKCSEDRKTRGCYIYILCRMFLAADSLTPGYDLFKDVRHGDISLLGRKTTKTFLLDDYLCREKTFVLKRTPNGINCFCTINYKNLFIAKIFAEWIYELYNGKMRSDIGTLELINTFEKSLGVTAKHIKTVSSFSGATFRVQINYYRKRFKDNPHRRRQFIKFIVNFYRYLIMTYPEFELSDCVLNKQVFMKLNFATWIYEDYHFMPYNPYIDEIPAFSKVIFVIKGFDQYSCRLFSEDCVHLNMERIDNEAYRKLIIEYHLSSPKIIVGSKGGTTPISSYIPMVLAIKQDPNNPNKNLFYYTNQEAILIRRMVMDLPLKLASKNNIIGAIRRFLGWAEETRKIVCDTQFFDFMGQIEEPGKYKVDDIPPKHLEILIHILQDMSNQGEQFFLVYVLFLLQLNTHFRIGTLCGLETDCVRDSLKPGKYLICTRSKTSHGEKHEYIITEETKLLIDKAIEITEHLRESVPGVDALRKKIFIYESKYQICCFSPWSYREIISRACKNAGLPVYNCRNIRNTYMTKSVEFIIKSGKSDAELGALTKHKSFETTNQHYLSLKLTEMLESTYGIIIGDLDDYNKNVIDNYPEEVGENSVVEYGCGRCISKDSCDVIVPLTCLVCEYFRTTVEYERYFIKAIERIDQMIKKAKTPHDKEDLTAVKRLYVIYLRTIYKRKEGVVNVGK